MKKLRYIILVFAAVLGFIGCEDLNEPVIWDGLYVGFRETSTTCYVDYLAGGTTTIDVEAMLIAAAQSKDITVNIEIIDTLTDAVENTHFSVASNTLTIAAGETFGTFEIIVNNSAFTAPDDIRELTLKLTSNDINIQSEYEIITVALEPFCPYDINDFVGAYTVNETSAYDGELTPYTINITAGDGDTLLVSGLSGQVELPTIKAVLNPETFAVTIPDQIVGYSSTYQENVKVISTTNGTFSTCFKTISVPYKIYISLGNFDLLVESTWTKQ